MTKYIFVTGGVLSSLGKGITAASIGTLLKHSGKKVGMLKIDPYINVDPGTMSPLEHGEVFVTKDGAETDLDIGNYERFLDSSYLKSSNFTTGQVYSSVIERERAGGYLGQTIQVIPHIVGEIVKRIKEAGEGHEILVVELGGTVGDIEGLPFMEAIRQMKHDEEVEGTYFVHVTLIPYIKAAGELKSKPTQHSVQELRRIGITPQMIIARSENGLPKTFKKKLAMSCDVHPECVIEALDAKSIYGIPVTFLSQNILKPIAKELELGELNPDMEEWDILVKKIVQPKNKTVVGFVGKYLELKEAYKSLTEALIHCGAHLDTRVEINWIDSEEIEEKGAEALLSDCDSVLVAGGFGNRGVEGKILAIEYARVNKVPYLGICLGMQLTLVEYARNVLGLEGANSIEFDVNTPYPMIYLIDNFMDQSGQSQLRTHQSPMGGTMRLGEYPCDTKDGSIIQKAYGGAKTIHERHRHRYEANPTYREQLEKAGMIVTGESNGLIETVEIEGHPWFLGVQFHPEFTSRLQTPNPSILAFVEASLNAK
ncbi:CTP synthase [Sulfurimonas aquatica]|uniref:CTP synthase n=1 Tax=Sulfurimonas aquatica TaxID=2672570 RepID=A0A975GE33_9BACT|nr:CTP synthase [Sulfurimonas aquatica]QSZ42999.1 CTP synthase [Sulfurimonas aquatica]